MVDKAENRISNGKLIGTFQPYRSIQFDSHMLSCPRCDRALLYIRHFKPIVFLQNHQLFSLSLCSNTISRYKDSHFFILYSRQKAKKLQGKTIRIKKICHAHPTRQHRCCGTKRNTFYSRIAFAYPQPFHKIQDPAEWEEVIWHEFDIKRAMKEKRCPKIWKFLGKWLPLQQKIRCPQAGTTNPTPIGGHKIRTPVGGQTSN